MNSTASRSTDQSPNWLSKAAFLRLQAQLWEAQADAAVTEDLGLGNLGPDYGQRIALRLREMAREAIWTAAQCALYASELPCQQDVGRTDEKRNTAPVIVLADVAGRTGGAA